MIRLSVIIPFFNVERYVAENLRSLAYNAATGIEFVLVDNGSTDATSAIVAEGAERLLGGNLIRSLGTPGSQLPETLASPRLADVISAFLTAMTSRRRATSESSSV